MAQVIREGMLSHAVLVERLLAIDEAGRLFGPHRQAAAHLARVPVKTVTRWLWQARDEPPPRTPPARAGWWLKAPAWDETTWTRMDALLAAEGDLRRGRKPGPRPAADLSTPLGRARRCPCEGDHPFVAGPDCAAAGVDTLIPEADVVVTDTLERTAAALRHVVAAGGVMNIDGAPGAGKTIALQYALTCLPPGPAVRRVQTPVSATVSQLRHAIAEALALKVRSDNRRNTTDQALATALRSPHVLVCDDIQRLSPPALEYLCRLAADPGAPTTLVLAGTGSTQALQRIPELASRILTRRHIPPLTRAQAQAVLPAFHPLWGRVPPQHIARADERCARGNFRAFAQITAHVIDAVLTDSLAHSGSALVEAACRRLGGI
ncbi:ATP-binding protein [Streptomyces sp. NPDC047981]|uniref:ATP-binding protein n=1 Tax=Streptomyces sp. NPDC047981 TaxID=3154610 RepID=UPI00341A6A98